jgi:hypothetical protein
MAVTNACAERGHLACRGNDGGFYPGSGATFTCGCWCHQPDARAFRITLRHESDSVLVNWYASLSSHPGDAQSASYKLDLVAEMDRRGLQHFHLQLP